MKNLKSGVRFSLLLSLFAAHCLYADLNEGLVAYYKLDGNALDEIGNNNGTEHNNTYTGGIYGQAASFDGVDDYIDLGTTRDILNSQQISFSYWVRFGGMNDVNSPHITSYNGGAFENGDFNPIIADTNKLWIGYGTGANQGLITEHKIGFSSNEWVNICIVLDSTQENPIDRQQLYVNGQFVSGSLIQSNDSRNAYIGNTSQIMRLGAFLGPVNRFMKGQLDEVRVYNRTLTENEIQELAMPNRLALTSGYYTFDVTLSRALLDNQDSIYPDNIKGLLVYNADTASGRFYDLDKRGVTELPATFEYIPYPKTSASKGGKAIVQGTAMAKVGIAGLLDAVTLGYFQSKETSKNEQLFISLAGAGTSDENRLYGTLSLRYNQQLSDDMNGTDDADTILWAFIQKKTGGRSKNR